MKKKTIKDEEGYLGEFNCHSELVNILCLQNYQINDT